GLGQALDHAARLLRPGSRLLVLADPASIAAIPGARWPALAAHHQVVVLLMTDPLELEPPHALLAFDAATGAAAASGSRRVELDLASSAQRARWQAAFAGPLDTAVAELQARGVRALPLSCSAPSDAWLPAAGTGSR